MWVFTLDGFFSAVETYVPGEVLVRGRFREDIERLVQKTAATKVYHTPDHDYPYRVRLKKGEWARYVHEAAQAIDYTNFKEAALKDTTADRVERYHGVWATMAGFYGGVYESE